MQTHHELLNKSIHFFQNTIAKESLTQLAPQTFRRIHFRTIGWLKYKMSVFRDDKAIISGTMTWNRVHLFFAPRSQSLRIVAAR